MTICRWRNIETMLLGDSRGVPNARTTRDDDRPQVEHGVTDMIDRAARGMRRAAFALSVAGLLAAATDSANAFDPKSIGQLMDDNHCEGCDLSGADLARAELSGAGLTGANLEGANLTKTILLGATLDDANLKDADLAGAYLSDAKFGGTDLTGANLRGAKLDGADLATAAGLTQAQLNHACAGRAGAPFKTRLPEGLTVRACK